jgi:hypothetical protein
VSVSSFFDHDQTIRGRKLDGLITLVVEQVEHDPPPGRRRTAQIYVRVR